MAVALHLIVFPVLLSWVVWIFFAACMRLKEVREAGKLTILQKCFGYPALLVGLSLDVLLNIIFVTFLVAEVPKEGTVSKRLWRLSNGPDGWRKTVATYLRVNLLDSIDPAGIHRG